MTRAVRVGNPNARPIHIAFDEWNVWYRTRTDQDRKSGIEERYSLTDALAVAGYLHGFIRHCRVVRMANLAQLVNAIAPIFTSPQGLFLQTIYHPLRLYAEHMRETHGEEIIRETMIEAIRSRIVKVRDAA